MMRKIFLLVFVSFLTNEVADFRDILNHVHFGDPVSFTCEKNGNHIWMFNNVTIMDENSDPHDNGYSYISGGTNGRGFSHLLIQTFLPRNLGYYSCVVDNVLVTRYSPRITDLFKLAVYPGESIRLNCSDDELNSAHLYWRYNDEIVYSSQFTPQQIGINNIRGETLLASTSVLLIDEFTTQNEGYYTCFASKRSLKTYKLKIRDLYLRIKISGVNKEELTYLIAERDYNISCVLDRPVTAVYLITTINSTILTTGGQQTILESSLLVSRDSSVLMIFPRNTLEVTITCRTQDMYFTGIHKSKIVLAVAALPVLRLQIDGQNVSGIYQGRKEQPVVLKCVAFGARPKIIMELSIGAIHNESQDMNESPNKYTMSTLDYEIQKAIVLKEAIEATCVIHEQPGFPNNSVCIKILVEDEDVEEGHWYDNIYDKHIAISIGVTFSVIFCICICVKRRYRDARQYANKYRLSRMSSLRGRQPLTIISLLHCGEIYSYWKSTIAGCANGNFIVAKTFTAREKTKGKINIAEISSCLQKLSQHRNLVNYLGRSIGEATQYIYFEYVDGGTLLSYLKYCQPQVNFTDSNVLPAGLIHPDVFVQHITEAIQYLHDNEFCHPVLSSSKVLLNGGRICKLFDFWPMEHNSYKITNVFSRELPPLMWLPPETTTLRKYDLASDIWSLGKLIWEIYSFGQLPSEEIWQRTSQRDREDEYETLRKPMHCSHKVFDLMKSTWNEKSENRPTISLIRSILNSEWNSVQQRENYHQEAYDGPSLDNAAYQPLIFK